MIIEVNNSKEKTSKQFSADDVVSTIATAARVLSDVAVYKLVVFGLDTVVDMMPAKVKFPIKLGNKAIAFLATASFDGLARKYTDAADKYIEEGKDKSEDICEEESDENG